MESGRTPGIVAVVGAGTMGSGIAQVAVTHGCTVYLADSAPEFVQRGLDIVRKNLDRAVDKGKLVASERDAALARLRPARALGELSPAELVVEAIVEHASAKRDLFQQLDAVTRSACVLATNTSSLSVGRIAEAVRDPGRVVGMHFFNPAPLMPLVEVIAGPRSSPACLDFAFETAKAWGKTAVRAKDTPGFIVNRVARGYYLEALRLLGEGVAGIDEIDNLCRVHGGFKMGPFELMDLVGLDVNLAVSTSVWEQMHKHPRFAPHEIQRRLVESGHWGRKSGRGFYSYKDDRPLPAVPVDRRSYSAPPLLQGAMQEFFARAGCARGGTTEHLVFCRILAAILNEAAFAFGEDVATRQDIDTAMLKGTNYPKGPMTWIDEIGPRTVRGVLKGFNDSYGDGRYEAAKMFAEC